MRKLALFAALSLGGCSGTPVPHPAPGSVPDPDAAFVVEDGMLVLPGPVSFATGRAVPTEDSDLALRHVVRFLANKPAVTLLRIEVHTDGSSGAAREQALSEARALAVAVRLIEFGADADRLLPVGFGSTKPAADRTTPAGRAQNSRVEFHPAALRGKPIGGLPVDGGGVAARKPGG